MGELVGADGSKDGHESEVQRLAALFCSTKHRNPTSISACLADCFPCLLLPYHLRILATFVRSF